MFGCFLAGSMDNPCGLEDMVPAVANNGETTIVFAFKIVEAPVVSGGVWSKKVSFMEPKTYAQD